MVYFTYMMFWEMDLLISSGDCHYTESFLFYLFLFFVAEARTETRTLWTIWDSLTTTQLIQPVSQPQQ
jgi:hypothetical protein